MKTVKNILEFLFALGIILFVILGIVIVLVQAFSLIVLNGNITTGIVDLLLPPAITISVITALISFVLGRWKE